MREVIILIERGDHHEALVRLWVLGTTRRHPDDDLPLNAWERSTQRDRASRRASEIRVDEIRATFNDGRSVDQATAEADPLALVVALDAFLGLDTAPRAFAAEPYRVGEQDYWLVPLNPSRAGSASSARQTGNPQSWFRHHRVLPATLPTGLRVEPQPSRDVTDTRLREIKHAGRMRTFLGHFDDGATLVPPPADRFFATGLSDENARAASVGRALVRSVEEEADVIVLPELTVTPAQREVVKDQLRQTQRTGRGPALVVPGSFHEERDGRKVNVAELLGSDGRRLLVHEKLRPFGGANELAGDIHAASILRLLVTPIGSIALAICKDYCDDVGPIRDWDALAVDWWLVPSMGERSTIDAHARRAEMLWQVVNRGVTLLANQESGVVGGTESVPGFVFDGARRDIEAGGSFVDVGLASETASIQRLRRIR